MKLHYHIDKVIMTCPYCDKELENPTDNPEDYLGSRVVFTCEYCLKKFHMEPNICFSSYANCELNDQEHVFVKSPYGKPNFFRCQNCDQLKIESTSQQKGDKNET